MRLRIWAFCRLKIIVSKNCNNDNEKGEITESRVGRADDGA